MKEFDDGNLYFTLKEEAAVVEALIQVCRRGNLFNDFHRRWTESVERMLFDRCSNLNRSQWTNFLSVLDDFAIPRPPVQTSSLGREKGSAYMLKPTQAEAQRGQTIESRRAKRQHKREQALTTALDRARVQDIESAATERLMAMLPEDRLRAMIKEIVREVLVEEAINFEMNQKIRIRRMSKPKEKPHARLEQENEWTLGNG